MEGKPREFRRLPFKRLADDLRELATMGATSVTFADEDFMGGNIDHLESFVAFLGEVQATLSPRMSFDASCTIHSIADHRDDTAAANRKLALLRQLREVGLRQVFLGIESGSPIQLRRYAKGHKTEECLAASKIVLEVGCHLELGFIMFDPLCSLAEVVENVDFLLDNKLSEYVSGPTSELRLQLGSRYLSILERHERELGRNLYDRSIDPNTLEHRTVYADSEVDALIKVVRQENTFSHSFVYRLKGLTRFGDGRLLGSRSPLVRKALGEYRVGMLRALREAAGGKPDSYKMLAREALDVLATRFLALTSAVNTEGQVLSEARSGADSLLRLRSAGRDT